MNEWEVFQWNFVLLSEYRDEKTFEARSRNSDMKIYSPDIEEKLPIPVMPGSSWSSRVHGKSCFKSRRMEMKAPRAESLRMLRSLLVRKKKILLLLHQTVKVQMFSDLNSTFPKNINLLKRQIPALSLNIVGECPALENLFSFKKMS